MEASQTNIPNIRRAARSIQISREHNRTTYNLVLGLHEMGLGTLL
jgi:hypothetical protein